MIIIGAFLSIIDIRYVVSLVYRHRQLVQHLLCTWETYHITVPNIPSMQLNTAILHSISFDLLAYDSVQ